MSPNTPNGDAKDIHKVSGPQMGPRTAHSETAKKSIEILAVMRGGGVKNPLISSSAKAATPFGHLCPGSLRKAPWKENPGRSFAAQA